MKYKVTYTDGNSEIIKAEECRQSGGGIFKKPQWFDFGTEKIKDNAIDVRDTVFYIHKRVNINTVRSIEPLEPSGK